MLPRRLQIYALVLAIAIALSSVLNFPISAAPPNCELRLVNELGVVDQNVLLGSRFETVKDATTEVLVLRYRICNGSAVPVTVTWRSAIWNEPLLEPGHESPLEIRYPYPKGLFGLLHRPVPVDTGATVQTRYGSRDIKRAPAYQTVSNVVKQWTEDSAKLLKEVLKELIVLTISRRSPEVIVFGSTVRRTGQQFEYIYAVRSDLATPLFIQWNAAASIEQPNGFIATILPGRTIEFRIIRDRPPVLIHDVAFLNTRSPDILPRKDLQPLTFRGDFVALAKAVEPFRNNTFVPVPAFLPEGER
jgi:hypothetical protein